MAHFNKVGLLILNDDSTKFLVCEKSYFTTDFIMPGGRIEPGENHVECLVRELREELQVEIDQASLEFIGEYVDVAAGDPTKDVSIMLYRGKIVGEPVPSNEIIGFQWIGKNDLAHPRLSPVIKNKLLPDLIVRNILA